MSKPKIIKPGTVVFDIMSNRYVIFKADSADFPGRAYVLDPSDPRKVVEHYLTTVRTLNRRERGEA
jgi:hypothetical protein